MQLCLAITTFNRLSYLKDCIETWEKTRNNQHDWHLVIADDGSQDGTIEYCKSLNCDLIENHKRGYNYQLNTILHKLDSIKFDVCFRIDDDMSFLKQGWDDLYLNSIEKTGLEHLVYNMENRLNMFKNIKEEFVESNTDWVHVMGCFYTITPNILKVIGYMDLDHFGLQVGAHIDYTYRCCRAGFNRLPNIFDALNSNNYLDVKWYHTPDYIAALSDEERKSRRTEYDPLFNTQNYLTLRKDPKNYVSFKERVYFL